MKATYGTGEIFANYISDQSLVLRVYKELPRLSNTKAGSQSDIRTALFTAALCTVAKGRQQPTHVSLNR